MPGKPHVWGQNYISDMKLLDKQIFIYDGVTERALRKKGWKPKDKKGGKKDEK